METVSFELTRDEIRVIADGLIYSILEDQYCHDHLEIATNLHAGLATALEGLDKLEEQEVRERGER